MSTGAPARVVLGVAGGIAAYKAAILLRLLAERHHCDVRVVPTAAALEFVGEVTWAALSGHPVATDVWQQAHEVPHVRLGQAADLVVVAPATADLLARAAHGLADDLLTSTLLTARCPVLMAPAMHTEMWEHPATQANVAVLRARGVVVLDPAHGRLTGADSGPGRLPEPEEIAAAAAALLPRRGDLAGRRIVVSAGGTREPLDPVRFLGNRSSGRQGYALAATAAARGADVVLVSANVEAPDPAGVRVVPVGTAEELRCAVLAACEGDGDGRADVVVMAAAVADFRPAAVAGDKIKKSHGPGAEDAAPTIELVRTPDVLAELVRTGAAEVVVGFAAETGDAEGTVMEHARDKLARKGCQLLVVNDVSGDRVFGREQTEVTVLDADGGVRALPAGSKTEVADSIWDVALNWSMRTREDRPAG